MGLRPLDLAVWLERDESSEAQRRAKEVLLANRFEDVVAFEDDARSACEELLLEVERACGRRAEYLEEHPLVAASRLVADDLCVMEQRNGEWVLTAAVVCAPSSSGSSPRSWASLFLRFTNPCRATPPTSTSW